MISIIDSPSSSTSATASGKGIVYAIATMHSHGINRFDCDKGMICRGIRIAHRSITQYD
jgi:hypothetical protein